MQNVLQCLKILPTVLIAIVFIFTANNIARCDNLRQAFPQNGLYSLQPECAPGKELTVLDASKNQGSNVIIWSINSNWHKDPSHQKWRITRLGSSEWYKIEAENSGLALNVHNGASENGTNVSIWPYGGSMHQFRFFEGGGGYYVIQANVPKAMVLDVAYGGSADGNNVHVWEFNNSASQKWKLVRRDGASSSNQTSQVQTGYINTQSKNLNLRNAPNGAIIGKLAKGTRITILQGNSNGWTKIRTDSGQEGYVSSQYVAIGSISSSTPTPVSNSSSNVQV